ncbi:MAG: M23 family metallopeptidase [Actinobacteria bacterium]|nr:M23 family metallopeptidase [Actinomycetota bacterium]
MSSVYPTPMWTPIGTSSTDRGGTLVPDCWPAFDGFMLSSALPPVTPVVVLAAFAPAPANWLPSHRGVDLAATPGQRVRAPDRCRVVFAGRVAGRGVVSLTCRGVRFTIEPVRSALSEGTWVVPDDRIGRVGHGGHCDVRCIHWGAKVDGRYVDPLQFLPRRAPVLKPLFGSTATPRSDADLLKPGTQVEQRLAVDLTDPALGHPEH